MLLKPQKAELIVIAIVCLHNFLRKSKTSRQLYIPPGSLDIDNNGEIILRSWRDEQENMTSLLNLRNVLRRTKHTTQTKKEEFTKYFCTIVEVPWQNQYA